MYIFPSGLPLLYQINTARSTYTRLLTVIAHVKKAFRDHISLVIMVGTEPGKDG